MVTHKATTPTWSKYTLTALLSAPDFYSNQQIWKQLQHAWHDNYSTTDNGLIVTLGNRQSIRGHPTILLLSDLANQNETR